MRKRILWNDIKGNRLLAVTAWLFMAISAFRLLSIRKNDKEPDT